MARRSALHNLPLQECAKVREWRSAIHYTPISHPLQFHVSMRRRLQTDLVNWKLESVLKPTVSLKWDSQLDECWATDAAYVGVPASVPARTPHQHLDCLESAL
jgi:hypothetical protein